MARPVRIEFEGAVYHVTARGNELRVDIARSMGYKDGSAISHLISHLIARLVARLVAEPAKNPGYLQQATALTAEFERLTSCFKS